MPRGIHGVFTSCTDSRRQVEYNRWYSGTHLGDLSAARGFVRARRFVNLDEATFPAQYLAWYEFDEPDLEVSVKDLGRIARDSFGRGRHIDCLQKIAPSLEVYQEVDPRDHVPMDRSDYPPSPWPDIAVQPQPRGQTLVRTLPCFIALVLSGSRDPAREEEYNRWYTYMHQPDLSGAKGLKITKRYRNLRRQEGPSDYLAYYEFQTDDPVGSWLDLLRLAKPTFVNRRIDCMRPVIILFFQEIDARAYSPLERLDYPREPSPNIVRQVRITPF